MKSLRRPIQFAHLPKNYTGLCGLLLPRPIRDKVDLENVIGMTDAMAGHNLTPDQEDYFDLLCRLVQDYESEHGGVSAPTVTGLEALRHLLEEHKMSGADLSRLLGAHRTLGPMILRGERKLTVEHVRVLCRRFNVAADLLL
ncbi:MAG TPA: transcriptional regulator [Clostridia bacterium]|nr:transcriptional regulator [Clostridia bacterium]